MFDPKYISWAAPLAIQCLVEDRKFLIFNWPLAQNLTETTGIARVDKMVSANSGEYDGVF